MFGPSKCKCADPSAVWDTPPPSYRSLFFLVSIQPCRPSIKAGSFFHRDSKPGRSVEPTFWRSWRKRGSWGDTDDVTSRHMNGCRNQRRATGGTCESKKKSQKYKKQKTTQT